jgi:hypothetical protein
MIRNVARDSLRVHTSPFHFVQVLHLPHFLFPTLKHSQCSFHESFFKRMDIMATVVPEREQSHPRSS